MESKYLYDDYDSLIQKLQTAFSSDPAIKIKSVGRKDNQVTPMVVSIELFDKYTSIKHSNYSELLLAFQRLANSDHKGVAISQSGVGTVTSSQVIDIEFNIFSESHREFIDETLDILARWLPDFTKSGLQSNVLVEENNTSTLFSNVEYSGKEYYNFAANLPQPIDKDVYPRRVKAQAQVSFIKALDALLQDARASFDAKECSGPFYTSLDNLVSFVRDKDFSDFNQKIKSEGNTVSGKAVNDKEKFYVEALQKIIVSHEHNLSLLDQFIGQQLSELERKTSADIPFNYSNLKKPAPKTPPDEQNAHKLHEEKQATSDKNFLRRLDRATGSALGMPVGDALGAPFEFEPAEKIDDLMVLQQPLEMKPGGHFGLEAGQWTDDTSQGLNLFEAFKENAAKGQPGFDPNHFMELNCDWWHKGHNNGLDQCQLNIVTSLNQSILTKWPSRLVVLKDTRKFGYITPNKNFQEIKINNFDKFLSCLSEINNNNSNQLKLSYQELSELITLNGGQAPSFTSVAKHSVGLGSVVKVALDAWNMKDPKDRAKQNVIENTFSSVFGETGMRTADKPCDGNGSTMRCAAPAIFAENIEEAMFFAYQQSLVTTPGLQSAACAALMAYLSYQAIHSDIEDPAQLKQRLLSEDNLKAFLPKLLALNEKFAEKYRISQDSEDYQLIEHLCASKPRPTPNTKKTGSYLNWRIPHQEYELTGPCSAKTYYGAYVMTGMALALHILHNTTSFDEAVKMAALMKGDADSNAAVVGILAGAIYGQSSINQEWLDTVNQHPLNQGSDITIIPFIKAAICYAPFVDYKLKATIQAKFKGQVQQQSDQRISPKLQDNPVPPQVTKKTAKSKESLKKSNAPKSLGQSIQAQNPESPVILADDVATDKKEDPIVSVRNNLLIRLNEYSSPVARFFARIAWGFTWPFAQIFHFKPAFDRFLDKQNLTDKLTNELTNRNSSQEINTLLEELNESTKNIPQQQRLDTEKEALQDAGNFHPSIFDKSEKELMASGRLKYLISESIQTDISAKEHKPSA